MSIIVVVVVIKLKSMQTRISPVIIRQVTNPIKFEKV